MDHFEKLELKKEITDEVREDITRYAGRRITSRILLALAIITIELLLWTLIMVSVVKDNTVGQGFSTCLFVLCARMSQVSLITWFNEK